MGVKLDRHGEKVKGDELTAKWYGSGMEIRFRNPRLERFIESQVKSGHFPDRESVVLDAVARMMEEEISLTAEDLAEIKRGDEEIERGEFVEYRDFAARMRKQFGIKKKK